MGAAVLGGGVIGYYLLHREHGYNVGHLSDKSVERNDSLDNYGFV